MSVELPLFVFGPMMSGGSMAHWLDGRKRQPARARGQLYQLPGGYPAFCCAAPDTASTGTIAGELVGPTIPEALLGVLDTLEGVGTTPVRRIRTDITASLRTFAAWAYVVDDPAAIGGVALRADRWRGAVAR